MINEVRWKQIFILQLIGKVVSIYFNFRPDLHTFGNLQNIYPSSTTWGKFSSFAKQKFYDLWKCSTYISVLLHFQMAGACCRPHCNTIRIWLGIKSANRVIALEEVGWWRGIEVLFWGIVAYSTIATANRRSNNKCKF